MNPGATTRSALLRSPRTRYSGRRSWRSECPARCPRRSWSNLTPPGPREGAPDGPPTARTYKTTLVELPGVEAAALPGPVPSEAVSTWLLPRAPRRHLLHHQPASGHTVGELEKLIAKVKYAPSEPTAREHTSGCCGPPLREGPAAPREPDRSEHLPGNAVRRQHGLGDIM